MEIIPLEPAHVDDRGSITDLLNQVEIRHIGLLTSVAGSVRGNHYHLKASQYNYLIDGKMEFVAQEEGGSVERRVMTAGDFALTGPGCRHAMRFLEDSRLIVFTTEPRDEGGYEDDTIRLEEPLIAPTAE